MPYCKDCGNRIFFTSSSVLPAASTAAGLNSGLVGRFDELGELVEMESIGASEEDRNSAAIDPVVYFDICMECGSTRVEW